MKKLRRNIELSLDLAKRAAQPQYGRGEGIEGKGPLSWAFACGAIQAFLEEALAELGNE